MALLSNLSLSLLRETKAKGRDCGGEQWHAAGKPDKVDGKADGREVAENVPKA